MPLLPIDLQTLFAHINQVGREQAVLKEGSVQYQFVQGAKMIKKTEQADNEVNETHEVGEGLEKVKEEKEREAKKRASGQEKKEKEKSPENEKRYFEDPDLGHHINIVG